MLYLLITAAVVVVVVGCYSDFWGNHRRLEDPGEVVPGPFRLLVQFAPHNACAGAGRRGAHAQRRQTGHDLVDQSTVPVLCIAARQPQPQRIIKKKKNTAIMQRRRNFQKKSTYPHSSPPTL